MSKTLNRAFGALELAAFIALAPLFSACLLCYVAALLVGAAVESKLYRVKTLRSQPLTPHDDVSSRALPPLYP